MAEHISRADDAIMLADLRKPLPANFFVVAERRQQRAGFAFASSRVDYFTAQHHAHVEAMAVAKEHEGAGVAAALLAACEEWARSRGDEFITLNVWMQNTRAREVCVPCPRLKLLPLSLIEMLLCDRYDRLGWQAETVHMRKGLK